MRHGYYMAFSNQMNGDSEFAKMSKEIFDKFNHPGHQGGKQKCSVHDGVSIWEEVNRAGNLTGKIIIHTTLFNFFSNTNQDIFEHKVVVDNPFSKKKTNFMSERDYIHVELPTGKKIKFPYWATFIVQVRSTGKYHTVFTSNPGNWAHAMQGYNFAEDSAMVTRHIERPLTHKRMRLRVEGETFTLMSHEISEKFPTVLKGNS